MENLVIATVEVPLRLYSEANKSGHWSSAYKRKKQQKQSVILYLQANYVPRLTKRMNIILTRIAPRDLDAQDNLPAAFKHIIDAIASYLIPGLAPGRADGDDRISWTFKQEKGKPKTYGIRIQISEAE